MNECIRLYMYNYSLYFETLKSREKTECLTEKAVTIRNIKPPQSKWYISRHKSHILVVVDAHCCSELDFKTPTKTSRAHGKWLGNRNIESSTKFYLHVFFSTYLDHQKLPLTQNCQKVTYAFLYTTHTTLK